MSRSTEDGLGPGPPAHAHVDADELRYERLVGL
jgi:hypothetical protein